jgi:arginine deiminase
MKRYKGGDLVAIRVYSEIGKLRSVLLHRPGAELENLAPNYLSDLLFDDIPFLKKAQEEHDNFAKVLQENGSKVYYISNLLEETLENENIKKIFLDEFLEMSEINNQIFRRLFVIYGYKIYGCKNDRWS